MTKPIVLDEEHEYLRPYIEQMNATGVAEITDIRYEHPDMYGFLVDYYEYAYAERYIGDHRWEGYVRGWRTDAQIAHDEQVSKETEVIGKVIDWWAMFRTARYIWRAFWRACLGG